jgi:plastocyanin
MKSVLTLGFIISVLLPSVADAGSVTGHIRFTGRKPGVTVPVVVFAEPLDGRRAQPGRFKMTQKDKTFLPRVLAVPIGSTISFPNDDSIFHNVFSLSRPNPFDLGLYRDGDTKERTFTAAATYRVFCNIHPQMSATILVVPTSFITETDNAGNYRLDLPAGRYRISAWSERSGQPAVAEITVGAEPQTAAELTLDESQFVDARHKNKFGQDYPKSAYDPKKN